MKMKMKMKGMKMKVKMKVVVVMKMKPSNLAPMIGQSGQWLPIVCKY